MSLQEEKKEKIVPNYKDEIYEGEDITWTVCMCILCLIGAIFAIGQMIFGK